jgi:hypothetical protein
VQSIKGSSSEKGNGKNSRNATLQSAYWYETATTLSKENAELTEKIAQVNTRCDTMGESITRLSRIRAALEEELSSANREIIRISTHSQVFIPPTPTHLRIQSIPVNTEGRDAMHWYQTCRTMEAQYIQKITELEARIDNLVEIITCSKASPKRKRTDHGLVSEETNEIS